MIRPAGPSDLAAVREIFREYAALVAEGICFESFERELEELPGQYAPPGGRLILAEVGGSIAGCVALRPLSPGVAEMKRLYVRPAHQGKQFGRLLTERTIQEARSAGHRVLRLDTLPKLERALGMYRAMGFQEIPRYGDNPPSAICFELTL